ncbi:MAG TPA: SDR family oxidoreductase [Solirubrobacteraceae bacterium]|jgi:NAD(P)-dependent dehydrogenase (short-subunit alcohol dehydrogenase family)|nr:SDR family oxidoreductase [Solirubrobacteraceae bacterium]
MTEDADGRSLAGQVGIVAGATRGAGRAIAIELGAAGATVYVTGRSTKGRPSPMARAETIDETAELVEHAGGRAIAVRVDHTSSDDVAALVRRVAEEQDGRLDVLVNDVWGGDPLTQWCPFWEHDLDDGLAIQRSGVHTHLVTSWHAVPLMIARGRGLIVEITDGVDERYRGSLYYDLAKSSVIRLAVAQAHELRAHGIAAVAVSPGFLRSEAMLDHFGVTEATWRDAIATDRHFAASETPRFVARGIAALAADPQVMRKTGRAFGSWHLGREYGVVDLDGSRPDWGEHFEREVLPEL